MSVTQNEYYVELSSFGDLARFACALQEYPKRVYSQELDGIRIISSSLTLANTLLIFYAPIPKSGRYVSYQVNSGKEVCDIVESTKTNSNYAPIIHMASKISSLSVQTKKISDQFHPIQVKDLGSLARLTYDPEFPDEQNLTLYALPYNKELKGYKYHAQFVDVKNTTQERIVKHIFEMERRQRLGEAFVEEAEEEEEDLDDGIYTVN